MMIRRGAQDLLSHNEYVRDEAFSWLEDESHDMSNWVPEHGLTFPYCCWSLGLDPDVVRSLIKKNPHILDPELPAASTKSP